MEKILARLTTFVGHLLIGGYDRVADCAFSLSFECAGNVLLECCEAVNYGAVLGTRLAYNG